MQMRLTGAILSVALATVFVAPVLAADKETRQMMADIRILQEQSQQLQNLIAAVNDTIKAEIRPAIFITSNAKRELSDPFLRRCYCHHIAFPSPQDMRKIVEDYASRSIPLDLFILDMDWHTKNDWTGYTFDARLFPNAADSMHWLKARGRSG